MVMKIAEARRALNSEERVSWLDSQNQELAKILESENKVFPVDVLSTEFVKSVRAEITKYLSDDFARKYVGCRYWPSDVECDCGVRMIKNRSMNLDCSHQHICISCGRVETLRT